MDGKTGDELLKLVNMGSREVNRELIKRNYNKRQILSRDLFKTTRLRNYYLGSYLGYVNVVSPDSNINDILKKIIVDENVIISHYFDQDFYDGFIDYLKYSKFPDRRMMLDTLSFLIDRDIANGRYKSLMRVLINVIQNRNELDPLTNDIIYIKDKDLMQQFIKENIRKYTLDQVIYQITSTGDWEHEMFQPIILKGILNYYGVSFGRLKEEIQNRYIPSKLKILKWLDDAILNQV